MPNTIKIHRILYLLISGFMVIHGALHDEAAAGPQMTFGPNNEGTLQIDYKGQFQTIVRDTGSGPNGDDTTSQFNFRRNRLAFMGQYGEAMSLYVQTEFTEDQNISAVGVNDTSESSEFQVLDAVLRFTINDALRINVGKFKYNLSRENLEDCFAPLTLDRSLFIRAPMVTTRDKGVAIWGNLMGGLLQYRIDAMNGRLPVTADAPEPESNFRYSARLHVSLLDPENEYGYKGTYLGKKKVLTIGAALQREANVAYADTLLMSGPVSYSGTAVDVFYEHPVGEAGAITLSGAYEKIDLDDAYKGANPDPGTTGLNGEKNGSYAKIGYLLPGGALQFFGRYEKWSFASLQDVADQKVLWTAGGLNYYIRGQNLKFTLEYSKTDFDKEGVFNGTTSKDFSTTIAQLQVVF